MMVKTALERLTPAERLEALQLANALVAALELGNSWEFGEAMAALTAYLDSKGV